ncbi:MAG: hypothetical protein A2Y74_02925 [Actinobacteria bacterium RBG_13_63_9]|nr:MAG: hypothetical protein A2Y74_02925 [Actinobacteria bacterium RBG_13_63_9]
MAKTPRIDNALIGAAGVHFVASELSRRGLIALPTTRNTRGIDVVIVDTNGRWYANVQVKTSKKKARFWLLGKKFLEFSGRNNYYAFVRFLSDERRFEVFLERADNVLRRAQRVQEERRRKGSKTLPSWHLPKDETQLTKVRQQWEAFGTSLG